MGLRDLVILRMHGTLKTMSLHDIEVIDDFDDVDDQKDENEDDAAGADVDDNFGKQRPFAAFGLCQSQGVGRQK